MTNSEANSGQEGKIVVERMGEAASGFLASLAGDQRAQATFEFSDQEERTRWYYTPNDRAGLPLTEMEPGQQRLAHQLVAAGLSRAGYATATTIMGLEALLDALEGWRCQGPVRDTRFYYLSVSGAPDPKKPWGWRFEGHHISLNYTILGGRIIAPTPTFFGANPAATSLGGAGTLRPLASVEDLARELVRDLDEGQRAAALIAPAAPHKR
jgi:hypothetical protein